MLLIVAQSRSMPGAHLNHESHESRNEAHDESRDESHDESRDESHDESLDESLNRNMTCSGRICSWSEKFPTGKEKRKRMCNLKGA